MSFKTHVLYDISLSVRLSVRPRMSSARYFSSAVIIRPYPRFTPTRCPTRFSRKDYIRELREVFRDIRKIGKKQILRVTEVRSRRIPETNTWQPFQEGQTVMLRRPKSSKFGSKWKEPFKILKRTRINYRIVSQGGKDKVVHHDQHKLSCVPFRPTFQQFAQLAK